MQSLYNYSPINNVSEYVLSVSTHFIAYSLPYCFFSITRIDHSTYILGQGYFCISGAITSGLSIARVDTTKMISTYHSFQYIIKKHNIEFYETLLPLKLHYVMRCVFNASFRETFIKQDVSCYTNIVHSF